jgi:hypothetical protein
MSGIWAQIQQQQAQRNADQAEQKARALAGQANQAQAVADRAQENARSLQVQSGQAKSDAASARQGLVARESIGQVQTQLTDLREQISSVLAPKTEGNVVAASSTPAPVAATVVNSFGQATGTLLNVTA